MSAPFLGEIRLFAGNFAPRGFAFCAGQLLPIAANTALFALLGTTYGGDGVQTFALPDLRGRAPLHQGHGPGLSTYVIGQQFGVENVTLTTQQLPAHTHQAMATNNSGTQSAPGGGIWATDSSGATAEYDAPTGAAMAAQAIGATGDNVPHPNLQPFLAISYIIALEGIFPARN
jgi:microcystin-dependent protein